MGVNHPSTVALVKDMERRELLARVAAERRADLVPTPPRRRPAPVAAVRHHFGALLVAVGRRLQGAPAATQALIAPPPAGSLDAARLVGRVGRWS